MFTAIKYEVANLTTGAVTKAFMTTDISDLTYSIYCFSYDFVYKT